MYAYGLRISEATTLGIGAIDRSNQVLRIIGKGDKERQQAELLPVPYFHITNTVPAELRAVLRANQRDG
ncbi:MAG TPA: hypothetical protein VME47_19345 [Acetobacteraceae bacterium]|nr:hypothetical protein [Acetobacteraceae bacterium]